MSKQGPDHAEPAGMKFGFILSIIGGFGLVRVWDAVIIFLFEKILWLLREKCSGPTKETGNHVKTIGMV